jgi:FkbM family methyltransferase
LTFISYAQNLEDVILWRALKNVDQGTYIDIGAQDPNHDSVSLGFYERGWRGLHVEPNPQYANMLKIARPDETTIEAAIAKNKSKIKFHSFPDTGLSTGVKAIAKTHISKGFKPQTITVTTIPLSEIFEIFGSKEVHWLKIDVEGMEEQVIDSWGTSKQRPWIVIVESTLPLSQIDNSKDWEPQLKKLGYKFVYFDGLNRFYVHRKQKHLLKYFGPGTNLYDDYLRSDDLNQKKELAESRNINLNLLEALKAKDLAQKSFLEQNAIIENKCIELEQLARSRLEQSIQRKQREILNEQRSIEIQQLLISRENELNSFPIKQARSLKLFLNAKLSSLAFNFNRKRAQVMNEISNKQPVYFLEPDPIAKAEWQELLDNSNGATN